MNGNADISRLDAGDLRALLLLFGEAAGAPGALADKKRRVLDALARLCGADGWAWTMRSPRTPEENPVYLRSRYGWAEADFVSYLLAANHPGSAAPFPVRKINMPDGTVRYDHPVVQLNPEGGGLRSETAILYGAAGVGKLLLSLRRLDDGRLSSVAFFRKTGGAAFDEREVSVVKVALNEADWLHAAARDAGLPSGSSPFSDRKASVMTLLFAGLSRREIARRVGLSEHTVSDYVKLIYRHFGVDNQAELVRLHARRERDPESVYPA